MIHFTTTTLANNQHYENIQLGTPLAFGVARGIEGGSQTKQREPRQIKLIMAQG